MLSRKPPAKIKTFDSSISPSGLLERLDRIYSAKNSSLPARNLMTILPPLQKYKPIKIRISDQITPEAMLNISILWKKSGKTSTPVSVEAR